MSELVKRTVHPQFPPKVEYELTEFGKTLCPAMKTLVAWAMTFQDPRNVPVSTENGSKSLLAVLSLRLGERVGGGNLAPAAPPESEGWQRDEDAERNQSGFFLPDFAAAKRGAAGSPPLRKAYFRLLS
jgi:hypothetical protein